jgi:hypothetical protein
VPAAVRELAETVRTLDRYFEHPEEEPPVSEHALRAAARATLVLEETANLPVSVIVGQVRSRRSICSEAGDLTARRRSRWSAMQPRRSPPTRQRTETIGRSLRDSAVQRVEQSLRAWVHVVVVT